MTRATPPTKIKPANSFRTPRNGQSLMDNPRPISVTPVEVLEWRENGRLEITPKFQRRAVWSQGQRSYFIETLLKEMPVPTLYFRNIYDAAARSLIHEVIDGQQRLKAVLGFVDGDYSLDKRLDGVYRGKSFEQLSRDQQSSILNYKFHCEAFDAITDKEVFEVFRRMNTYSTPLTKQELRHGRYFGPFSQSCERLAMECLDFWRENRVLSEPRIARMAEVQFTSSMLITQIDGLQDKNDSIDYFYESFDDRFPSQKQCERQFRTIMEQIEDTFEGSLVETQFRRPPFFYSLFCAVYHRTFGIPKELPHSPRRSLNIRERKSLRKAVSTLSRVISLAREQQKLTKAKTPKKDRLFPQRYDSFAAACLSQTDNIKPRRVRLKTLYVETF